MQIDKMGNCTEILSKASIQYVESSSTDNLKFWCTESKKHTMLHRHWLRVSLESNPGLISTPGVEFWNFGCRILQLWNFGVEFSI